MRAVFEAAAEDLLIAFLALLAGGWPYRTCCSSSIRLVVDAARLRRHRLAQLVTGRTRPPPVHGHDVMHMLRSSHSGQTK